jgi:hypothetical protein
VISNLTEACQNRVVFSEPKKMVGLTGNARGRCFQCEHFRIHSLQKRAH